MATAPLFISTKDKALKGLRLSHASVNQDAQALIDDAFIQVRVGMIDRLGKARVDQIVAYTSSDTPSSTQEIEKARAAQAEQLWLKWVLLQSMPTAFLDSSSTVDQSWNAEGLTRNMSSRERQDTLTSIWEQIDQMLTVLETGEIDTSSGSVTLIEPDEKPFTYPMDSVFNTPVGITGNPIHPQRSL